MFWKMLAILVAILGIGGVVYMAALSNSEPIPTVQQCTDEAKICPDGSSVGRTGPNCAFAACPVSTVPAPATSTPDTTMATTSIVLGINETGTADGVSITPRLVVSDSRCPSDPKVQCIWAGTVQIKVHITDARSLDAKDASIELGKSVNTQSHHIVFSAVDPVKKPNTTIATSTYRFTFEINEQHWPAD